jgi:hypothetical protein
VTLMFNVIWYLINLQKWRLWLYTLLYVISHVVKCIRSEPMGRRYAINYDSKALSNRWWFIYSCICLFIFTVLGIEFRASCLLSKHFIIWAPHCQSNR